MPEMHGKQRLKVIWSHLIWQPLAAMVFMGIVLFFLNLVATSAILWAVGAGSIASSCFVVFAHPSGKTSDPKSIVGSYAVAILTGEFINFIAGYFPIFHGVFLETTNIYALGCLAAFTVGLAIFLMVLFNLEHPPATGMALVLVLDIRDYRTLVVVFLAAVLLALIRKCLVRCLCDLL